MGSLAEKTIEIAMDENITIYDASYVALAAILNTKLYTADKKLVEKLAQKYDICHISQAQ
ncbi:MAG: type II toxin-antitoxin system VapC family toxin [Candidatus Freyarchaeota archaeon]|nr:type II toxin-antitoxin system VapC family toxin [Candidatus Jordarchaeia archaeon]